MKKLYLISFFCFQLWTTQVFSIEYKEVNQKGERHFVIVTASYNNKDWYKWNLDSVFAQTYENFDLIYVDDCSPDLTGALVEKYIKIHPRGGKVHLIRNKERKKALANIYKAIHLCDNRSVIIILDGDDSLAHPEVLLYLNQVYKDPNIWLTYGQYREYPSGLMGFCVPMPDWIVYNNAYRKYPHGPSHLRTFYAGLFKKIKVEDLMYKGDFFPMTYDLAIMFPMLEMAGNKFKFIEQVLLNYNASNPLNDHKVNKNLQSELDILIRNKEPYSIITSLFN